MISSLLDKLKIKLPPLPTTPPKHSPSRSTLLQLAVIIGLAVIMHFQIADFMIGCFALFIFAIKVVAILRGAGPPNKFIIMLLTIASLGMVIMMYGGWNGQRAGISFLVLLVALKFLESEALRDYFVVCLILYFLAASSFLFNSSIFSILIIMVYTLAITSILFQISNPTPQPFFTTIKASLNIVARAMPLAVLLFFFFPRIQGNFGFLPAQEDPNALSDALVAGELSLSAFNNSLAFRVDFRDNKIPPRDQLYWRAKVMPIERDFSWELDPSIRNGDLTRSMRERASLESTERQDEYNYDILHEKSSDSFLPYLDYVAGYSRGRVLYNYTVFDKKNETSSFRYSGRSTINQSLIDSPEIDRDRYLQVERNANARILGLLQQFRSNANNDRELTKAVLDYFAEQNFVYSLEPPGLDEFNRLGDFLFRSRVGYCEHYASAFTTLMRYLRVPARVVVGYQGGTIIGPETDNPYIEVKYSDAHAWSEVWLDGGWQRIDPTAVVSEARIEYGMDAIFELWDSDLLGNRDVSSALSNFVNPTGFSRLYLQFRDTWKSVGYQWNKWIVNYDSDAQEELLSKLGFSSGNHLAALLTILFGGAFALLLVYFWRLVPRPVKRLPEQNLYLQFTRKFKKLGIAKEASETPSEFAQKAVSSVPGMRQEILAITQEYENLRYGNTKAQLKQFKKKVHNFTIKA